MSLSFLLKTAETRREMPMAADRFCGPSTPVCKCVCVCVCVCVCISVFSIFLLIFFPAIEIVYSI